MQVSGHDLVGVRRQGKNIVGALPEAKQVEVWTKATSGIVKYGFVLEYRDLEPPRTGIFDGCRIVIDPDVMFEMQCFVLLHLFGHSVQWVAPEIEHQLDALQSTSDKARFMQVLHDYEFEAARFGLQLLHEVGIRDLDGWYSDFVATDWRYVACSGPLVTSIWMLVSHEPAPALLSPAANAPPSADIGGACRPPD